MHALSTLFNAPDPPEASGAGTSLPSVAADTELEIATVVAAVSEQRWRLGRSKGELEANRALSCLLAPEVGDRVLLVRAEPGGAYILAVLTRPKEGPLRVRSPHDLSIEAPAGRVTVGSAEGIALQSAKSISMGAGRLELRAREAELFLEGLQYLGERIEATVGQLHTRAEALHSVAERCVQRLKRSYRVVEELDHHRAEQVDFSVRANFALRAKNALVAAKELIKLDGDQIHLG